MLRQNLIAPSLIALTVLAAPAMAQTTLMEPAPVREGALRGEIILVDIRRPSEWAETGIADVAIPLDMEADDFRDRLAALQLENPSTALGLICRSGGRSNRLARQLADQGWSDIVDVAGGTLRWIDADLPIRTVE